ncbi:hypothetical protein [Arthrobacter pityocampae]|uniref:hypothetical protein n=1 Tax=Arthrobacter pityocampae TaxID=547334 RepID=UPI003736258D
MAARTGCFWNSSSVITIGASSGASTPSIGGAGSSPGYMQDDLPVGVRVVGWTVLSSSIQLTRMPSSWASHWASMRGQVAGSRSLPAPAVQART